MIAAVAQRLAATLREGDVLARLGGDEFTILCEDVADEHTAVAIAERILDPLRGPLSVEGATFHVTASIGLVTTRRPRGHAGVPAARRRRGDCTAPRTAVATASSASTRSCAPASWTGVETERGLRLAQELGELELRYQPIVRLDRRMHRRRRGPAALVAGRAPPRAGRVPGGRRRQRPHP